MREQDAKELVGHTLTSVQISITQERSSILFMREDGAEVILSQDPDEESRIFLNTITGDLQSLIGSQISLFVEDIRDDRWDIKPNDSVTYVLYTVDGGGASFKWVDQSGYLYSGLHLEVKKSL